MQDDNKPEFDDLDDFELDDFDLDDEDLELGDLDIEDLEEIEAGDVDVDDEFVSDSDDWDDAALSEPSGVATPQANKTLIYGILGVVLLVVFFIAWQGLSSLFGGGSDASQMVQAEVEKENVQTQDTFVVNDVADAIDAPPMPMPITNDAPDETAAFIEMPASKDPAVPAPALTPLPNFEDTGEMPMLPSLDNEEETAGLFEEPAPVFIPASVLPKVEEDHTLGQVEDTVPASVVAEAIVPTIEEKSMVSLSSDEVVVDSVIDNEQLQNLNAALDEKSALFEVQISQIRTRLDDHDGAMVEIMASLQRIEAELKSQKADIHAVREKAASVSASKKAVVSVPKKLTSKKKVVNSQVRNPILYERSAEKAKIWVLKSAQPGKAIVAEAGTNYLRSVEVGASLPGLGKVTSISNVSGRWVVQGTQGRITQ